MYRQEAKRSDSPSLKEHYFELADAWDRMAADLEYTQSFTGTMANIAADFEKPPKTSRAA